MKRGVHQSKPQKIGEPGMKKTFTALMSAAIFSAALVGGAQAEIADRTIAADAAPEVLFQQIVTAATVMCHEAAAKGETFHITRCVDVVVARTVEELNKPTLTAYAMATRPAIASV
jgi:hypothetical protein